MKKFALIAAAAASVFSTAAMAAPNYNPNNGRSAQTHAVQHQEANKQQKNAVQIRKTSSRNWKKGERFDSRQAVNYRVISQPGAHGLKNAPKGYRWVQSGNDAVLIGLTSGIVAAVLTGAIH